MSKTFQLQYVYAEIVKVRLAAYNDAWNSVSEEERFVLHDFAGDYFVNYRNRFILLELIRKGLVIADPLTGGLRLMSFGFRRYLTNTEIAEIAGYSETIEARFESSYKKWRVPLLIIALSVIVVVIYVFKGEYDEFWVFGSSLFTTTGMLVKYLNFCKKGLG